jgi:hypothetical protein
VFSALLATDIIVKSMPRRTPKLPHCVQHSNTKILGWRPRPSACGYLLPMTIQESLESYFEKRGTSDCSDVVAVCSGLEGSATLLRRSRTSKHPDSLGNATGCLWRYLAGHSQGVIFPFVSFKKVGPTQTKTFAINAYHNGAPDWSFPLGVIQVAGQTPFWERPINFQI